ncbi:hypothetical protein EV284_6508 [Streptomyces sp. BK022]|uniref:hypothetical protein n=1 Tax=Streptomyces sp. BK022 TaxID=2512123 RepID=UPI001029D5FC|nr:hypothetical protein [Streptomyces sp. BK022]RZU28342.1 hypothetical protein EV284_6508 [Streptomyces sp. BK022]
MTEDQIAQEIERLARLEDDDFVDAVVRCVTGAPDRRLPRAVQEAALSSPQLAGRTADALETALRRAKHYNQLLEGETRRAQQIRIEPWRAKIKAALGHMEDIVDDQAHEHAKQLASLDDAALADRWTAFILGEPAPAPTPRRVEALAFRSHRVAARAAEFCRLMMENPGQYLPDPPPGEGTNARQRRIDGFRKKVESEARFLRYGVQYADARLGRMPGEPNVRLAALRLLGKAHPEELTKLLRQVRGEDRAARHEARQDARAVRRAATPRAR